MNTSRMLTAAIELARCRWPVFAVGPDKKPFAGTHGVKDATVDEAAIAQMWAVHPGANVAVACGDSGPTVIDVDMDLNKCLDGDASLATLQELLGALPETRTSRTPRGGRHLYFRSPTDLTIKNTASKLAPGIDVRSGGGYVLVPPSVVADAPYEWLNSAPLAALPEGWLEAMTGSRLDVALIREGGRNNYLTSEAGRLRNLNLDPGEALEKLLALNEARCRPPLPRPEVIKVRDSVWRYERFFQQTDYGNAERFVHQHGPDVRWVHEYQNYIVWTGHHWSENRGEVELHCKRTVRQMLAEAAEIEDQARRAKLTRWALFSESSGRIAAAMQLARSEPGITITVDDLDADPLAFVAKNVVIDLRTGQPMTPRRESLLTKQAGISYDPTATCPTWLTFIERVLRGDAATIDFLQRAVGYSLTGLTTEHVVFFLHGTGANGKSTFISTVRAMLGEYVGPTSTAAWMSKKYAGVGDDLAVLQGSRFAATTEGEDGQYLDESRIKQIAGGDAMGVRKLYGTYFQLVPQFKLWMASADSTRVGR